MPTNCSAAKQLPQFCKHSKSADLLRKSLLSHVWRVPSSKALSCKHERLFDLLTLASFYYKSIKGGIYLYTRRIISVAGAVLSIGVCVFITWFSRDVGRTTIFFNLGFLALMLCMILAASLTGMRRLMQITRSLRRATEAIRDRQGASGNHATF